MYKELISLRNRECALRSGSFRVEGISKEGVYIYSRRTEESVISIIINRTGFTYYRKVGNIILQQGYNEGRLEPYGYVIKKGEI